MEKTFDTIKHPFIIKIYILGRLRIQESYLNTMMVLYHKLMTIIMYNCKNQSTDTKIRDNGTTLVTSTQ